MLDTFTGTASTVEEARSLNEKMLEKIYAAAQPGAVFSPPVVSGEYTVITASSVSAGGGFGFGSGVGPAGGQSADATASAGGGGGGGGGGSAARPIAAIVIGPDGVKVKPIVDTSKIALAALGAWASVAVTMMRLGRQKRMNFHEKSQ
jgi:uncharacterized spore protein YtfJ